MNAEEKNLLKYFAQISPCGVKGRCKIDASYDTSFDTITQYHEFECQLTGIDGELLFVTPLIEDADELNFALEEVADGVDYYCFTPYLRPMSSMTEEEKKELLRIVVGRKAVKHFQVLPDGNIVNTDAVAQDVNNFIMHWINFNKDTTSSYIDWLNEHHFDYRGLIKRGFAIEAPKGMYEIR